MPYELVPLAVTVPDAIKLSSIGRTSLYKLLKSGTLKSTTIGRRRLIDLASLKSLLGGRGTAE